MLNANKRKIKTHILRGDQVRVIAGNEKGKEGKVLALDNKKKRVLVEGINFRVYNTKPNKKDSKGKRERKETPVHISNLQLIEPDTQQLTRVGRKHNDEGKLKRYAKKTQNFI